MKYLAIALALVLGLTACDRSSPLIPKSINPLSDENSPANLAISGCNRYVAAQLALNVAAASNLFYKNEIEEIDKVKRHLDKLCMSPSPAGVSNVAIRVAIGELAALTNNNRTTALAIFGVALATELIQAQGIVASAPPIRAEVSDRTIREWLDMQSRLVAANREWNAAKVFAPEAP